MLKKTGVLIAIATVMLQLAVILQPLLPEQYQVAPVCEKISAIVITQSTALKNSALTHLNHVSHQAHVARFAIATVDQHASQVHMQSQQPHYDPVALMLQKQVQSRDQPHDHHNSQHQCLYCVVYGLLVMPPHNDVVVIFWRTQQRLLAFQQQLQHLYFALQRLYLVPQGRAPPYS